jgi:Flp pilus assembly pilin Flp
MSKSFREKPFGVWRLKAPRLLHRFLRRKDGATAVEFGLVALPFLMLLFAIIETALIFFAQQTLETAVADSARLVLTGQVQKVNKDDLKKQGLTELGNFKKEVCARIYALFECDAAATGGLIVDVRAGQSFDGVNPPKMDTPDDVAAVRKNPSYQPGGPGAIVAVRLIYEWPVLTWDWLNLSPLNNGKRLLIATAVFRNEPFPPPAP